MSRRRYISTVISIDRRLQSLSDSAALLYTWMIPHAEDDATLPSNAEELANIVVPNRKTWNTRKVALALEEMASAGLITTLNGTLYFPIVSFYRYQSSIPAHKRRTEDVPANDTFQNLISKPAQNSASPSPSPSPSPSKALSSKPDDMPSKVFGYWKERCNHPGAVLSVDRRAKIEARLREGATVERLCQAIDGCAESKFHMGDNDQGRRYDSIGLIFRNAGKVDEFAELAMYQPGEKPPDPRAKQTRITNARQYLDAGDEDMARAMCKSDEWEELRAGIGKAMA
jgi:hypothetical protein